MKFNLMEATAYFYSRLQEAKTEEEYMYWEDLFLQSQLADFYEEEYALEYKDREDSDDEW